MSTVKQLAEELADTFEFDLGIVHHFSGGVYAKQMTFPKGAMVVSHSHEYDHLSILAQGTVVVKTDETQEVFTAPACLTIKAGVNHAIGALEDTVWFCIHATEETDPEKVDKVLIEKEGS